MEIKLEITRSSILDCQVEAIVNAANEDLMRGGGVCGVIHKAAGVQLDEELFAFGGCKTGEAVVTKGYKTGFKHIIHTVAPRWYQNPPDKEVLLFNCYINSLKLADSLGIETIAFPALGMGIFQVPLGIGSKTALMAVNQYQKVNKNIRKVVFALPDDIIYQAFDRMLDEDKEYIRFN
jgi:O-acetyl-ADP-ribose deacetylase (regulator of RNase III)